MRIHQWAGITLLLAACARPARPSTPPPADRGDAGPARPATGPAPTPHGAAVRGPTAPPDAGTGTAPDRAADVAECPTPDHAPHCLWLATTPPNKFRARLVAKRLGAEGYAAIADADRVIVHADDAALARLFGKPVTHERHAASASNRMRCVAMLPHGAALPARYRGLVGPVMLDDPACEM